MAALTVLYVGVAFVDDQGIAELNLPSYWYVPFLVVFLLEFTARCVDAENRLAYLQDHWIDLVTSVPMVGGLRLFRLLRLLRLVKVGALVRKAMVRGNKRDTWFVWPTVVIFWVTSAYALWLFEHGTNPRVSSFGDALYLAFMTAATVGYGDVAPVTVEGKVMSGLIVFFAIGLLGFASSRLTTWWLGAQDDAQNAEIQHALIVLEAELQSVQHLLAEIAARLGTDSASATLSVRSEVDRARASRQQPVHQPWGSVDRRDPVARAVRDKLAALVSVHPRVVGTLPLDVVATMVDGLEHRSGRVGGQPTGTDRC